MTNEDQVEMFKAVVTFATLAIKSIIVVNGAAVIALLAFLGNIWDKNGSAAIITAAGSSLGHFVYGLICGVATAAFSYLAQVVFAEVQRGPSGRVLSGEVLRVVAVTLAIAGLVFFALGARDAHKALLIPPPVVTPQPVG